MVWKAKGLFLTEPCLAPLKCDENYQVVKEKLNAHVFSSCPVKFTSQVRFLCVRVMPEWGKKNRTVNNIISIILFRKSCL